MGHLCQKGWEAIDAYTNEQITAEAGASTHEVRAWVAAAAAIDAACRGSWSAKQNYYRAIPEWVAGFGSLSGSGTVQ